MEKQIETVEIKSIILKFLFVIFLKQDIDFEVFIEQEEMISTLSLFIYYIFGKYIYFIFSFNAAFLLDFYELSKFYKLFYFWRNYVFKKPR